MRALWIVLIVLFAVAGALFGALNSERVSLDFYWLAVNVPKGAAWLVALLLGWIAGGLVVYGGVVLPLRSRLARARRQIARHAAAQEPAAVEPPRPDA